MPIIQAKINRQETKILFFFKLPGFTRFYKYLFNLFIAILPDDK